MKVIVTDANSRKAFDIINILKEVHGLELILFSSTGYQFSLPLIYGQRVYRLRNDAYQSFKDDILSVFEKYSDEKFVYIPVSEEPTLFFYELLTEDLDFDLTYLLPEKEKFELVRDKKKFQAFCEHLNLPVPASYNRDTFHLLKKNFYPVIAKMKIGAGSVGMKYIEEPGQLGILDEIDDEEYLIQQKIESGSKIHGGFFLCKDGEIKVYHGHERIRTFPQKGGVTVFSKAAYNPELKKIGASLLKELSWNGFAMIEFLKDETSAEWKIIELNPRLWGSIMLAEFCRSSMLGKYISLSEGKKVVENNIETDCYIRWIFPFEVLSLIKGKISFGEFLNLSGKKTCYINFTYSSMISALLFQLYFTFNTRSIKRFFKKIFS